MMFSVVWSRRHPAETINYWREHTFQAPYLPWALLAGSVFLGNSFLVDLMGIGVGHIYYFLEDVYPPKKGGVRPLETPKFMSVFRLIRQIN